jgi:hypothetical protein
MDRFARVLLRSPSVQTVEEESGRPRGRDNPCLNISSKTIQTGADGGRVTGTMGYDRPLDYVFLLVEDHEGDILYSNLGDPHAGTEQRSVDYYRPTLKGLGITLPESMFTSGA